VLLALIALRQPKGRLIVRWLYDTGCVFCTRVMPNIDALSLSFNVDVKRQSSLEKTSRIAVHKRISLPPFHTFYFSVL
jgi:hypothetical protein